MILDENVGHWIQIFYYNWLQTSQTLDAKIKQKGVVGKSDISGFMKNVDLDKKVATLVIKAESKAEQDKILK